MTAGTLLICLAMGGCSCSPLQFGNLAQRRTLCFVTSPFMVPFTDQHLHLLCRYAQRSKASRLEWSAFTKEYFLKRETLANVLLLVDSSIPVQACTLAPDLIKRHISMKAF